MSVLFRYIPPIVWIYLLPVFGTTWGITPAESPLYDWCSLHLLPAALLMLTMSTDVKAIARLGPLAIGMLLAGTAGIVVGGPIALAIFQSQLDPQTWKAMGALAGAWIGGGSNMLAIKEGVHCPDDIFSPIIIVDSVVGYGWMTIMIAFSGYQDKVDKWNCADRRILDELNARLAEYKASNARPITLPGFALMLGTGFVGGWVCMWGGNQIPEVGSVLSHYTWGILFVVIVGLVCSFTPVRRIENEGASSVAYGGLYLLVATMGATGNLRAIAEAPLLLLTGAVWIGIHILCLAVAARMLRAPCFLFATGSMGNVGGVISTPVVAGVYHPALAPVGILMGVLGNLVGTPAGLLCAQLMSWVAAAHFGEAVITGRP
ncbi:MAG: DUF819 family protein [Fuerstiella sp.]|nr:DUF819 family protein [Fuerstiella sp.]